MSSKHLGIAAVVLLVDTVLLLGVGASMWSDAASAADEAVGKGLVALGAALAVPTIAIYGLFLGALPRKASRTARSDWDTV